MPQALHWLGVREKRDKGEKGRTAATGEYIMEKNKSDFSWKTLLSVGGAFAADKSTKQRIIIVVTALVGIFAGSVIPFGTIINVLYPFAGCIGVVLFHLSGGAVDMIDGIADAAEERGFALTMIKKRAGEKMTLAEAARRMSQLPVDGMIFNLRQMVDDFDTFEAPKDLKTVIITPMEHPTCSTVSDDQEGGARMACEYFLNHGHKNVYFVSGKKESLSSQCRMKGWRAALEARGIEPPEPLQGDWNADSGYAAGLVLADKPDCTAVLAANDCMANGVMMALRDKGLNVPDDVSVIGFDDELYKTIPNSILTSVKFRHRELGIRALNEVVAGLEAPSSRSRTLVSGVLVERSSVRDLRA